MQNIPQIEELIKQISKLPGLGPKSAKRILLKLINEKNNLYKPLINSLADVFKTITRCLECGSLRSIENKCENCNSIDKKNNKICVVEDISDQWSILNSNIFNGYFHILGGTINASTNSQKKNLLIQSLANRVKTLDIDEVIVATSSTIEGQTTAYYIQDVLRDTNVKITRLAQGIPIGGEIENLDDGTLVSAFKNRKKLL